VSSRAEATEDQKLPLKLSKLTKLSQFKDIKSLSPPGDWVRHFWTIWTIDNGVRAGVSGTPGAHKKWNVGHEPH